MKKHLFKVWVPLLLLSGAAQAHDGFESVRCGSDIAKALAGKQGNNEAAAKIEARHADLGLKLVSGDELSDTMNSATWIICGSEYMTLIDRHDVVRDAIAFPPHSATSLKFGEGCQANGKEIPGGVVALLDDRSAASSAKSSQDSSQDKIPLTAKAVWKIDEKAGKFVVLSTSGFSCPRSAVTELDPVGQ